MEARSLVVVESPTKARTLSGFLGSRYRVMASVGHVRDLPNNASEVPEAIKGKDWGSMAVDVENDFQPYYVVSSNRRGTIRDMKAALKDASEVFLATDPDREGEAISWHLQQALAKSIKKDTKVSRVVFNAITKSAVTEAMKAPRQVDMALVEAYLARRALDYLVGFTLSPVLWRKLPGAKSAGRVQSVCLRLIVEREMEIEAFRAREYWGIAATLTTPRGENYEVRLTVLGGKKLDKFDIPTGAAAEMAVQKVADSMGISLMEAAEGIIKIVNESMFGALRLVSV